MMESPSNKLLYAKEISTYKKMVEDYYKGIRQMVQVSDQDMNTHLAEISRAHTESLNTLVALHQLYQYTKKYYDEVSDGQADLIHEIQCVTRKHIHNIGIMFSAKPSDEKD
ncbi:hypothetical protein AB205_0187280 [Aquarana catesbeiana]|uniref:Plexin cytoplasmic RasGAP domain-containing protein n=1 Tax=Aquarana catesbeiana TaxID=8400 RepID=A0A2G9S1W0_AQUCT|nr:hypothetical protein AB205_0187280 [Aquarana catesbeiana]